MLSKPEDIVKFSYLLDYYGSCLTPRQRNLFSQYVDEDCSLSEIAQREQISPQAVSDALKHAEKTLLSMENKLRLMQRIAQMNQIISQVKEDLNKQNISTSDIEMIYHKLNRISDIWEEYHGV